MFVTIFARILSLRAFVSAIWMPPFCLIHHTTRGASTQTILSTFLSSRSARIVCLSFSRTTNAVPLRSLKVFDQAASLVLERFVVAMNVTEKVLLGWLSSYTQECLQLSYLQAQAHSRRNRERDITRSSPGYSMRSTTTKTYCQMMPELHFQRYTKSYKDGNIVQKFSSR